MVEVSRTLTSLLVEYYGKEHQLLKAAEELAELLTVLIQGFTKEHGTSRQDLYSEVADVYIMLDQLVLSELDEDILQSEIRRKLNRTFERLKYEQRKEETPKDQNGSASKGSEEGDKGCR